MNAAVLAVLVLVGFYLGYRFYSRYLSEKLFNLDEETGPTPAEAMQDGVDFVPTQKSVLFGHHYSSIAGAAPIVGPAVAVIWGWVPALLWVLFGTLFMGAVHDFGTLVLSMRNRGHSIGQLTGGIIGSRARNLFLLVIFFLVWLVIAVFALVIAKLFVSYPSTVLPINFEIIVAIAIGWWIKRRGGRLLWPSLAALASLFFMIWVGTIFPISLEGVFGEHQNMAWIVFLLIYSYIASVLPVWLLLQPRDYINSHQLIVGLGLMILGLIVVQPTVVAPALNLSPQGAPNWFPFLFITIACGAVSGFHGLVSSGTTSKQVRRWKDARMIGYGGMLGEGVLALLATLAATTGFDSLEAWHNHYGNWQEAKGLSSAITAFVGGSSQFISGLGIPESFAATMIGVLIISFAATSLDTASRIQRYVIAELGDNWNIPVLKNRFTGAGIAVGTAFLLMLVQSGGKGGLVLWPLFGATNQMLAALSLVVITIYLMMRGKKAWAYLLPAIFLIVITFIGLVANIQSFYHGNNYLLMVIGTVLLVLEIWIIGEGWVAYRRAQQQRPSASN